MYGLYHLLINMNHCEVLCVIRMDAIGKLLCQRFIGNRIVVRNNDIENQVGVCGSGHHTKIMHREGGINLPQVTEYQLF